MEYQKYEDFLNESEEVSKLNEAVDPVSLIVIGSFLGVVGASQAYKHMKSWFKSKQSFEKMTKKRDGLLRNLETAISRADFIEAGNLQKEIDKYNGWIAEKNIEKKKQAEAALKKQLTLLDEITSEMGSSSDDVLSKARRNARKMSKKFDSITDDV